MSVNRFGLNHELNMYFLAGIICDYGCGNISIEDFPESVRKNHYGTIFRLLKAQNRQVCRDSIHELHLLCEDQIRDYEKCDFASTMRDLFKSIPNDCPDIEQIKLSLDYIFPFEKLIENKNE